MNQLFPTLACALLLPALAHALPVLSESTDSSGRVATIHPDHLDPNQHYFFPNQGAPTRNSKGVPNFALTYWDAGVVDSTGGFMSGVFKLSMDPELKASIDAGLAQGQKMSVMPVQRSYIRFMQNQDGTPVMGDFFKAVNMPPYSGRAEDSIGLSASLQPGAGRAFAMQILNSGYGGELEYCYEVKGVSPLFMAQITLNYHKIYTHFVAQASGGRWWWKWSIRTEIEKLIESKTITIDIQGGDAKQADYVMNLVDHMVEKFFIPELENRRAGTSSRFSVGYNRIEEDRDFTYKLTEREIVNREYCVSLGIQDLQDFPNLITEVK